MAVGFGMHILDNVLDDPWNENELVLDVKRASMRCRHTNTHGTMINALSLSLCNPNPNSNPNSRSFFPLNNALVSYPA